MDKKEEKRPWSSAFVDIGSTPLPAAPPSTNATKTATPLPFLLDFRIEASRGFVYSCKGGREEIISTTEKTGSPLLIFCSMA
jgi:hypothetical protein